MTLSLDNKGDSPLDLAGAEVIEVDIKAYNVATINSIKKRYPMLRQDSKAP